MEAVRLVIWDLDGVFWHGTLAEEGAVRRPEVVAIVIELARRGIMSAVCSKNDFARAEAELCAQGAWDYLVFPSIDWTPKGARIAALVEAVQLRPETILFIDDLPANLAEARYHTPKLQVAGPELVPDMLGHPLFAGKPDPELTRLAQYRLLQQRHQAASQPGGDNLAFLRASNIRVMIDYDVETHLDRAIELINRTNQLNFTKSRLPEDMEEARTALRAAVSGYNVFAGLVRAIDNYGDYGFVGFYCGTIDYGVRRLTHFCFSCRVMNMGLETYIHQRLRRPALRIEGEVSGDPFAPGPCDWITPLEAGPGTTAPVQAHLVDRMVLRGGCDLQALAHYLSPHAAIVHEEFTQRRASREFRIEHSQLLPHVFSPPTGEMRAALEAVGYCESDWNSAIATPRPGERQVWVLSFWIDDFAQLYKHKELDLTLPFLAEGVARVMEDLTRCEAGELRGSTSDDANFAAWQVLKRDYWCVGTTFEDLLRPCIERMMAAAQAQGALVFIMLAPKYWRDALDRPPVPRKQAARMNEWLLEAAPGAVFLDMLDLMSPDTAYPVMLHFDRLVYQRAAAVIAAVIAARFGGAALPP